MDADVLKTGLVLADLPGEFRYVLLKDRVCGTDRCIKGLQDTNLARVQATQDYLMHCDRILLVTQIARAVTDQSLQNSLYDAIARLAPIEWELREKGDDPRNSTPGSFQFAVVCTRSDVGVSLFLGSSTGSLAC